MSCWETILDYGLRSVGIGERLLPQSGITLCQQVTLIGSGMIWNLYFGVLALGFGFFLSVALALGKAARGLWLRKPCEWFIFVFRGSPLFIQFFLAYSALVLLPRGGMEIFGLTLGTSWMTRAWAGAALVLFLNTSAYAGEIFHGALKAVPRGDVEAAAAFGMGGWTIFRRITFPTMLRLAWPAYTNEAVFLFHATTLVFFSSFPARQQMGDALYYAKYFADRTFNPFIPYPIAGGYFVLLTLALIGLFGLAGRRLNRHLPPEERTRRGRIRLRLIR